MNWFKTLSKSGLGILTFLSAWLIANTDMLVGLMPENVANMTVGSIAAALVVGVANYMKHKDD